MQAEIESSKVSKACSRYSPIENKEGRGPS